MGLHRKTSWLFSIAVLLLTNAILLSNLIDAQEQSYSVTGGKFFFRYFDFIQNDLIHNKGWFKYVPKYVMFIHRCLSFIYEFL